MDVIYGRGRPLSNLVPKHTTSASSLYGERGDVVGKGDADAVLVVLLDPLAVVKELQLGSNSVETFLA